MTEISIPQPKITAADGSPASPEQLYQALQDDDAEVRVSAALSLITQGDLNADVIELLFGAADWRAYPEASSAARYGITALAQTNPTILELLIAALQDERVPLSGVAECLGDIGQATLHIMESLLAFALRSQNTDPYAAVSAAHSLAQLGDERSILVDLLRRLCESNEDVVRNTAFRALSLIQRNVEEKT